MATKLPPLGEPSPLKRRALWAGAVVGIVAAVAVVALSRVHPTERRRERRWQRMTRAATQGSEATGTPSESVSAEQALSDYITTQLKQEYAGDCTAALMPDTPGLCSAARGERQNRKAFLRRAQLLRVSPLWVFLRKEGSAWKVESTLPVKPETVNAPGAPWPLEKGAKVIVGGTGTCLNVRAAPGIKEAAVDCIADGTVIVLEEGPVDMDGYQWWRPEGRSGWVAGDWLPLRGRQRNAVACIRHFDSDGIAGRPWATTTTRLSENATARAERHPKRKDGKALSKVHHSAGTGRCGSAGAGWASWPVVPSLVTKRY